MIIPGGALFIFFLLSLGFSLTFDENKINPTVAWAASLVISYLLGLINQTFTSFIWKSFRNNPHMIKYASEDKSISKCSYILFLIYLCPFIITSAFILGLWHKNNFICIATIPFCIFCIICLYQAFCYIYGKVQDEKGKKIQNEYLEKYYYVVTHTYRNDISIIEGQIAFMQSLLIPIFCILLLPDSNIKPIFPGSNCDYIRMVKLLLFFIITISIPVIFIRQMKIYQCVFEDFKYLKLKENIK